MVVVVKAPDKHAAKVKALPVHRAMALLRHAEMGHKAHKVHRALKARAMAAEKAHETVVAKVVAVKNNAAIPVLTTVGMAKGVPHRVVPALRAVAPTVAAVMEAVKASTIATAAMATSCHATSTP